MKRILFLLLLTVSVYGQNPSRLAKIQITGNSNSGTATKVNVQEANGEVNTQTINTGFNKNIGLGGSDVVGANTLLNQYSTTPVDWTATTFSSGQVVFYGGKQWIAKMATVAGDVPSVSSKWEDITFEALSNKTVIVDATPTDGSNNAVSSNGVFDALATKAPISSVHNPVTLGTANGLSLATQQLSLGLASSGTTGALSGTDWNTFNNKQPAITGLTANYLPKWNGSGFGNSGIFEDINGLKIGSDITQDGTNEYNGVQIKAISPTEITKAGRGLNVINKYSGNFASTAIQVKTLIEGANNQDHNYGVQSWQYGNGTGLINQVAGYMSAFNNNTNTISNYYSFLANSAVGSNILNSWGFYTFGGITSYMNKLIVGDSPSSSNTPYFLVSRAPYSDGPFGITSNNITAMSSSTASIGKGGVISLGGKKANGDNSEYQFAFLKGSTQSVSNYLSAFEIYTTSGGGDGEVDSGNYKRYYADGESHKFYGKNNTIAVEISKNGTISASPATTANQVVVKSQLDAVVARPYKVIVFSMTQPGTGTPTFHINENNSGGTFSLSRNAVGVFTATFSGISLTGSKTVFFVNGGNGPNSILKATYVNSVTIQFNNYAFNTANLVDGLSGNETFVEIRIYP